MKPGDVIHYQDDTDAGAEAARRYCKLSGLTSDDVRLIRRDGKVLVEVKRPCVMTFKHPPC